MIPNNQSRMKLIKKANKKESRSGKATQETMRRLSTIYSQEIVYMPYGEKGRGFYTNQ